LADTNQQPRLAGVVGYPVSHSFSPIIHQYWFNQNRIDGAYVRLPVQPENLEKVLRTLPLMGFAGVNVTIPHKTAMFELIEDCDATASRMKAVNTVLFFANGHTKGLNTDGFGFLSALKETVPTFNLRQNTATLLGTGGACRAIADTLIENGIKALTLTNRTKERAETLATILQANFANAPPITIIDWEDRAAALSSAGLLVNCSSLGMRGQPPLDLKLDHLPTSSPVFDIVYNPLQTKLLKASRARGNPVIDGLGMLLYQAIPGFTHWGGIAPKVDQTLRAKVLERL
jgi:shikimate dehydrogenase